MAESGTSRQRGRSATVLPLVADSGNRRMLTEWIADHDRYDQTTGCLDTAAFDICILDSDVLERKETALRQRKEVTAGIVPVLLLVPDTRGKSLYEELRQDRPVLWELVDGTVRMPVREIELTDRVDTLLQLRAQSETLSRQREQFGILNRVLRHDIRNDMTVVLGWLDYVAEQTDGELSSELDRIKSAADHVVELTTAAGDISETISSDTEPELEATSLTDVLIEEGKKRRETFDEATIELPESPPDVTIAANELLSSVFRNLINNAVQHNEADEPVVSVTLSETDGRVQVRVADNGPGVPETLKGEVFGDEVKGLESSGTGMGLFLVSTLVGMYGGEVWVEDNDPTGAVFCIEFDTIDGSSTGSGE